MKRKKKYIEYDIEETYTDPIEKANDKKIQELLKEGYIRSVYATKTIKAGDQFEVEIYPEYTKKESELYDLKKKRKQAQKNLNDKNSRKRLERLINANFTDGDYWITFTYDKEHLPESIEEAQKNMKNYIKRINYRRKKAGLDKAKYIYITEFSESKKIRCHHHLIMDCGLSMDIVESVWKCGKRNNIRRIAKDEDGLTGLAKYLTKDPKGSKRWCSSINLKKPVERKSYSIFKARQVKKMVEDMQKVKELLEKHYKRYEYLRHEIRFNEVNHRFYVYVRMKERCNQ